MQEEEGSWEPIPAGVRRGLPISSFHVCSYLLPILFVPGKSSMPFPFPSLPYCLLSLPGGGEATYHVFLMGDDLYMYIWGSGKRTSASDSYHGRRRGRKGGGMPGR